LFLPVKISELPVKDCVARFEAEIFISSALVLWLPNFRQLSGQHKARE
jgi:hypothetical protein